MQCLGYYEYVGEGYPGGVTDSYNAKYYGIYPDDEQYEFNINVKVDWTLTGRTSDKTKLDIKIYVSNKDYEDWRAHFSPEAKRDSKNFKLEYYMDGGENVYSVVTTVDGSSETVVLETGDYADDAINDWLTEYIIANKPHGASGWKPVSQIRIKSGSKSNKVRINADGSPDGFDITSSTYVDWKAKPGGLTGEEVADVTIEFLAPKTEDFQVYARYFNAERPNNITLSLNKTIKNESNYSSNFFNLPEYKLSGTKFYLYESETGGSPITQADGSEAVLTITGDKGGNSNEVKLGANYANKTIYLEEILPDTATGFKKPTERIAVTLPAAGKSHTEPITNEPIADPAMLRIEKISTLTSDGKPIADIDYNNIKYTLSYFGNGTSAKSNAYSNSSVVNTWVFATKEERDVGAIDFTDESYKVSGDALYKVDGQPQYPVGWYRIQENQDQTEFLHNKGLEVSKDIYYINIKPADNDTGRDFEIFKGNEPYESPIAGRPAIKDSREGEIYELEHWEPFAFVKKDINLSNSPEGDTELQGAIFTVYSEDANRFGSGTTYDGQEYTIVSGVVCVSGTPLTITIDEKGRGICKYPLPKTDNTAGNRFYIQETTAPTGYKKNDTKYFVDFQNPITVNDLDGNAIELTVKNMETGASETKTSIYSIASDGTVKNTPRKGSLEIEKFDAESDDRKAQGDSSLKNIKFAIVNRSTNAVYYNNKTIAKDHVVYIAKTDLDGKVKVSGLPYGTYDVYEISRDSRLSAGSEYSDGAAKSAYNGTIYANDSYLLADENYLGKAEIRPTTDDDNDFILPPYEIENYVVRAKIKVTKRDTEMTDVQGDASLAGIRYAIVNSSDKPIIIDSDTYNVGEVVYIIETDESGVAATPKYTLPYGTYDIYELRSDSSVEEGYSYEDADKGTSIYANDNGYLFTENVNTAKTSISKDDYDVNKRQYKAIPGDEDSYEDQETYTVRFTNVVSNGKLTVQKFDDDAHEEQGDTSFNGINFAVVNRSDHPVYYENKKCGVNTVVAVHTTKTVDGVNGIAVFENLPYGRYQVYELGRGINLITPNTPYPDDSTNSSLGDAYYANDSYMLKNPGNPDREVSGIEEIHPNNTNRDILVETDIANTPARGTITVQKYDAETNITYNGTNYAGKYQGDADFEGIRYAIVNRSRKFVKILIKCYLFLE